MLGEEEDEETEEEVSEDPTVLAATLVPPGLFSRGGSCRLEEAIFEVLSSNPFTGKEVPLRPVVPRPKLNRSASPATQLQTLQTYIESFEYNFLPTTFFNKCKYRPLPRILETAKEVMRVSLPIRCLEAVYLGIALTQGQKMFQRFPLTFKTSFNREVCRHIVLALRVCRPVEKKKSDTDGECWGALGLSRKRDLMFKALIPQGLKELIGDFIEKYEGHGHKVLNVKIGLPVDHVAGAAYVPCWRFLDLQLKLINEEDKEKVLENFVEMSQNLAEEWGKLPKGTMTAFIRSAKNDCSSLTNPHAGRVGGALSKHIQSSPPAKASAAEEDEDTSSSDEDEEDDEDDDEGSGDPGRKSEVVRCILARRSPFRRNQFNTNNTQTAANRSSSMRSLRAK